MEDAELVRRCLDGDTAAFDLLVQRYRERVFGLTYHLLGDADLAEDLAQEAFLKAFNRLSIFDLRKGCFSSWLMKLSTRLCLNALKKRTNREQFLTKLYESDEEIDTMFGEVFVDQIDPEEIWWTHQRNELIHKLILTLPPMQRASLLLHYGEGLSVQEIASTLNSPIGTVKAWLFRGREALRRKLKEVGIL